MPPTLSLSLSHTHTHTHTHTLAHTHTHIHTCKGGIQLVWENYSTDLNGSCHTSEWFMAHIHWTGGHTHTLSLSLSLSLSPSNTYTHTHTCLSYTSSISTHARVTHVTESCVSHMWMNHVTYLNESCHISKSTVSHIQTSHVTHLNESRHFSERVL